MTYVEKLSTRIAATGSNLCVGLDPRPELLGDEDIYDFCSRIIAETLPFAAAYKPNSAYFEALGSKGFADLERLRGDIPDDVPLVLDAKRGDIGTTQKYYAKAAFEVLGADAVTLNPYLGRDSLEPFFDYDDKGFYILGVTSNPGSADIQQQTLADGRTVFEVVGGLIAESPGAGLVLGLTSATPEVLARIPDVSLLVPGLGAQGGDLARLTEGSPRKAPVLVNVSRGVLFADEGNDTSATERARDFRDQIAAHL